jgi:hypothetical protein
MTKLPRRRIEPLDPPPGSFDRVLLSARRRRRRTARIAASSTMVIALVAAASFAVGSSLNVKHRFLQVANQNQNHTSAPSALASPTPSGVHHTAAKTLPGQATPGTAAKVGMFRGRAIDPDGIGIAGLYVLLGIPGQRTFSADDEVAAWTDRSGYYAITCPQAPVLLATWQLDQNLQAVSTGGSWAATFVEGSATKPVVPSCGKGVHATRMGVGASLHGVVHAQGDCAPGTTFPVWVWLDGNRATTVRLTGLRDGDTFSFTGLPAGVHLLGTGGVRVPITFLPGDSKDHAAAFACANGVTTGATVSSTSTPPPSVTTTGPPVIPSPTPSPTVS